MGNPLSFSQAQDFVWKLIPQEFLLKLISIKIWCKNSFITLFNSRVSMNIFSSRSREQDFKCKLFYFSTRSWLRFLYSSVLKIYLWKPLPFTQNIIIFLQKSYYLWLYQEIFRENIFYIATSSSLDTISAMKL